MQKIFSKKLFLISLIIFAGFGFVDKVEAATNVYYSVGQNTTDHKTGSPTLTISGGVGTFSVPQTATNMGVGDKVTFNTSSVCYISGKVSTSEWNLIQANGATCGDVTNATVDSIAHAFSSLNAAVGGLSPGAAGASYLNTSNISTGDFVLNIPVYYDSGADTTPVTINGWTTDSDNYIRIYTATSTNTEVNQNQRHNGTYQTSKYRMEVSNAFSSAIEIYEDYIFIDGLQFKNTNANGSYVLYLNNPDGLTKISNSIIAKATNTGLYIGNSSGTHNVNIWNNIIYDSIRGININASATLGGWIYNNTLIDNTTNGVTGVGFAYGGLVIKNNIVNGSGTNWSLTQSVPTTANNISEDTTSPDTSYRSLAVTFSNEVSDNFHIDSSDTSAKDAGSDLGVSFATDIDDQTRSGTWDIGADEYTAADTIAPVISEFTVPSTASSYNIPITTFTATDAVGVTGYLINESSATPSAGDSGWTASAPSTYSVSSNGSKILYAWAKDAAGNVSSSATGQVTVNAGGGGRPRYNLIMASPEIKVFQTEAVLSWKTNDSTSYALTWWDDSYIENKSESTENKKEFSYTFSNLKPTTPYSYTLDIKGDWGNETQVRGDFKTLPIPVQNPSQSQTASVINAVHNVQTIQSTTSQTNKFTFTQPIKHLETSPYVKLLQIFLNKYPDTKISNTGPGSPGQETEFYGAKTLAAVKKFQEKYASEILYPNNLTSGTGYVGPSTIKKINQLLQEN